jgi:hypothetical protein
MPIDAFAPRTRLNVTLALFLPRGKPFRSRHSFYDAQLTRRAQRYPDTAENEKISHRLLDGMFFCQFTDFRKGQN